jgi:hypothetical protein
MHASPNVAHPTAAAVPAAQMAGLAGVPYALAPGHHLAPLLYCLPACLPACLPCCEQDRADAKLLQQDPTGAFLLQPRLPWLVSTSAPKH